ncbi:MAG: ATP-binding protein [Nanoarchaeota archaeon]
MDLQGFNLSKIYTTEEKSDIERRLKEYLMLGGLPEVYKFGKQMAVKIYEDILTKDILIRHQIKKVNEFKNLAKYLISNSSEETTYSKLSRVLNIKHISTVSNWVGYIEEVFLAFRLERFSPKLKQQFIAPKKIYCYDTGIVDSIGFKFSENRGKTLENAIAIELQRRKEKNKELEVYYWKDATQHEVDFVIKGKTKVIQLIQSTYINSKDELKEKRVKPLLRASSELKCDNLLFITWNYEGEQKIDGKVISFIPLWKWLLSD